MNKLYIFDMNGTLSSTPFVDKKPLSVLPGRKEKIAELFADGAKVAIATNQGGVAFGFSTEKAATAEVEQIAAELGISHWRVSFGHPSPKFGYEQYGTPAMLAMRKPAPGMNLDIMKELEWLPEDTICVGDRDEDQAAALAAGCQFVWAKDFFADPGELLGQIYQLYQQLSELQPENDLRLMFYGKGAGDIHNPYDSMLARWSELYQAPGEIQEAITRAKQPAPVVASSSAGDDFDPFLDDTDLP